MLDNHTMESKFHELLIALKEKQYLRVEEMLKNNIAYCKHADSRREDKILKNNIKYARILAKEVHVLTQEGMGHDKLNDYLRDSKNYEKFM